jgi:type IV pilus assembly protein PilM
MDDQSKAKEQMDAGESPASGDKPTSIWKKELSFKRKPKADAVADTPVEEPVVDEPVAEEPAAGEPAVAEETVWKKEVSFGRGASREEVEAEPVVAEATADEVAPEDQTTDPAEQVSETHPVPAVWKKEVSFSRKPEAEPVAEQSADEEPVAEEEPVANEEMTPTEDEQPVPELEPVATEELVAVEELVAEEPIAAASVEVEAAEPWSAVPVMPPAPAVVHPPVAAADLPPLPDEDLPKVPFWKKELSLGGKKGDKPVKERKQKPSKVKAERAPKTKEPKQPKQPKEPKAPKVKAERGGGKGRLVGLKVGASQLAAARVENNGTAELLQVAREPLAPGIIVGGELRDPDALAEALKDFFMKHGLPKKGVRLGIANNRIGVRTFEVAGVEDEKQLANAIRFRAQEALPIPIDEAVLDYQILGEGVGEDGQPTKRVLLVVAYRELIDRYVDACKKAGITLIGIDLEAFALLRALQAPQEGVGADATAALVVVAIGHERSTFAVSDGRVCEFTRVLEWGGSALNVAIARSVDAAPSEVEGTKRALSLMDEMVPDGITADQASRSREAMRKAIQTFARELVSSLQYYQNQPGSLGIGEIVLTGGTAHLPGLAGELERLIGVHVRVGDPLARLKVSKKVGQPEQIGSLAVAIGLGIED